MPWPIKPSCLYKSTQCLLGQLSTVLKRSSHIITDCVDHQRTIKHTRQTVTSGGPRVCRDRIKANPILRLTSSLRRSGSNIWGLTLGGLKKSFGLCYKQVILIRSQTHCRVKDTVFPLQEIGIRYLGLHTLNFYKLGRSRSTTSSRLFQRHTELQNHYHNVKF